MTDLRPLPPAVAAPPDYEPRTVAGARSITTVIVNWNTEALLDDCLRSIVADVPAGWSNQIVVVDNASSDGSVAKLRRDWPDVAVIANDANVGFCRANNQVLRGLRSEVALLVNTDARLTPGATAAMLAHLERDPRAAVVGPRLVYGDGSFQRWTAGAPFTLRSMAGYLLGLHRLARWLPGFHSVYLTEDTPEAFRPAWVSSAVMMLRGEALHQVGPLADDIFVYMDDVDWCQRATEAGWHVWYAADATAVHFMGASSRRVTGKASPEALRALNRWFVRRNGRWTALPLRAVEAVGFGGRSLLYAVRARLRDDPDARRQAAAHRTHLALSLEKINV